MMTTILIYAVRLSGVAALGLGVALWLGVPVPVHAHMGVGGVVVLGLWGLAIQARGTAVWLSATAGLWGLAVPVLGMAQLHPVPGDAQGLLRLFHVAAGLGAIALGERLAGRLRRI